MGWNYSYQSFSYATVSICCVSVVLIPMYVSAQVPLKQPQYIKELKSPSPELRSKAALKLGSIGSSAAVPPLIAMFKDPVNIVRNDASEALRQIGSSAVPLLISALKDRDYIVRYEAIYTLSGYGPQAAPAVPALITELRDPDLCGMAANALGAIGSAAVPALTKTLKDPNSLVRNEAARALCTIGPSAKRAAPTLIDTLKDPDPKVRTSAAYALGKIGSPTAIPALIATLNDTDAEVRDGAVNSLRLMDSPTELPRLTIMLTDNDATIRADTAKAVSEIAIALQQKAKGMSFVQLQVNSQLLRNAQAQLMAASTTPKLKTADSEAGQAIRNASINVRAALNTLEKKASHIPAQALRRLLYNRQFVIAFGWLAFVIWLVLGGYNWARKKGK